MADSQQPRLLYLSDEQLTTLQRLFGFEGRAALLVWPPPPEPAGLRELADAVRGMAGDLRAVAGGNYQLHAQNESLRAERDELEGQQAEKFFAFAADVRKDDFWDFALIMALGNRRLAARHLQIAERSFYERVGRWSRSQRKGYQKMARLVAWRKAVSRRLAERLPTGEPADPANPEVVKRLLEVMQRGDNLDYPALVKLIFVGLRSQNRENWAKVRGGLMDMIEGDLGA